MLIGQLVKQSGLSKDTIRFYEMQGLIKVTSNWRNFSTFAYRLKNKLLCKR